MATMYVYNIPTDETVNLRKTASSNGTILVRVPYGKPVQASYYNSTWHSATYNDYSGYIMSKYLTSTNPNGGSSGGGGSYLGQGTVIGGRLYCRKQPQAGYAYWGQFNTDDTIPIYSCSTSGWYETRWPANGSNVGYVMSQYIQMGGGGTGGNTSSHTAIVCQGNTDDAGDCVVFYNKLNDVYSSVVNKGFSPSTGNLSTTRASQTDFKNADGYDVLYWSSHGNSTPMLNLGDSQSQFNSYSAAYSAWNSTSDKLKVAILAACHQLDGATNRSQWASIMRRSNIRAICGYHEGAPGHPYDKNLAEDFFSYVKAGSTGNSVMYSWQHANQDNGNNSTYMVLVYQDDNQCYYRLPGFSSQTYRNPNRSTDSIYAYASFMTGAVSTAAVQPSINGVLPYELVASETVVPATNVAVPRAVCCSWQKPGTGATFVGYGEFPNTPVDMKEAQKLNLEYASQAFGAELLSGAQIRNVDTVMFEVFGDGTEGEHTIIGHATQFINHYNGIPLAQNCIVITSDANGLHSVSNKWQNLTPAPASKMIHVTPELSVAETQALTAARQTADTSEEIKATDHVYIEKNGRYVLHRDVELMNGNHVLLDCQSNAVIA